MPVLDWARTDLHYANVRGTESMHFDYDRFAAFDIHILRRPGAAGDYPSEVCERAAALAAGMSAAEREELAHNIIVVTQGFINGTVGDSEDYKQVFLRYLARYDGIGPDRLREHLAAFLKEVCPAAREAGVNLCIHPDDPPFPLLGLPRIASTIEDFRWILRQYDDPVNGVTFCAGRCRRDPITLCRLWRANWGRGFISYTCAIRSSWGRRVSSNRGISQGRWICTPY